MSPKMIKNSSQYNQEEDTIVVKNDSLNYEIIITDVSFSGWLATQRPRGFYTQQFMEIRNQQYVVEYNNRFRNSVVNSSDLYTFEIEYNHRTDYGYEVNYLLYHYFLFFEEKYNQKLR